MAEDLLDHPYLGTVLEHRRCHRMAQQVTRPAPARKKQIRQVFSQLHRSGRPVVITVNGRPDVVLLDAAVFERKLSTLNLRALVTEGEADVPARRTRPAQTAVRALRRAAKISR